jgi:hypothetical protein
MVLERFGYAIRQSTWLCFAAMTLASVTEAHAADPACASAWTRDAKHGFWEVEYDMTGSELETRNTPLGAGDATQTIRAGGMTIRFEADSRGPASGPLDGGNAQIVQLSLLQDFVLHSQTLGLRADVSTQVVSAIPDNRWDGNAEGRLEPGSGSGWIDGTTLTVHDPGLSDYRSVGSMLCKGFGCTVGRLQRDVPQPIHNHFDLAGLDALYFEAGGPASGAGFTSNQIELPTRRTADPFLTLRGREVRRAYIPAPFQRADTEARCYSAVDVSPSVAASSD